jgi:uncharacterized protein
MGAPTLAGLRKQRVEIVELARRRGAHNVRVFGSTARRDASSNSDVDFIVDLDADRSLFDLGGLLMVLQDLLGCDVDLVTSVGLRPRVAERVLADAVAL